MSFDAQVRKPKYPDEIWVLGGNWETALNEGDTLVGTPTVNGVGVVIDAIEQDGNVTKVKISGGTGFNTSARLEFLATISTGEKLGFNLGVPIRPR